MSKRKLWSHEEDQFLTSLVTSFENQQKKIKWSQIAQLVRIQNSDWVRNGKQCRQRWINHLIPSLQKFKQIDVEKLFQLMKLHTRKWNLISKEMPGKTDNEIKNFFYISLRKGLGKLNTYITTIRLPKKYKLYSRDLLQKILSIHDQKKIKQLTISNESADGLAHEIRQNLVRCSKYDIKQPTSLTQEVLLFFENLNQKVEQFSKICRFKKSKYRRGEYDQAYQYLSRKKIQNQLEVQQKSNVMIKQQQKLNEQEIVNYPLDQNNKITKLQPMLKQQTINQMYNYIYQIPQQFLIKYQSSEMYQLAYPHLNENQF